MAVHLSDEPDDREGNHPQLQRERVVRRRARTQAPGEHRSQLSGLRAGRDGHERQHAAAVSAGDDRRGARAGIDFSSDYHALQMSAERRGSPLVGEGLLHVRQGDGGHRLSGRRAAGGAELEPASSWSAGARPADRTHNFTLSGVWNIDYLRRVEERVARALLNGWTVSTIITLQSGAPLTISAGPGPQLRRADQRSRGHHRRSDARLRPAARGS